MTEREKALRLARIGLGVTIVALIAMVGIYIRALAFTPIEINQGAAQKIFYVHVPSAWSALLAFSVTGILSILYLWLKDARIDLAAASSAEISTKLVGSKDMSVGFTIVRAIE